VSNLVGFLLLTVALSATPGPDDVLVLRYSLAFGPRCGTAVAVGVAAGTLIWGTASAIGLATAISRSGPAYELIRSAGAVYLVLLGVAGFTAQFRDGAGRSGNVRGPTCRGRGAPGRRSRRDASAIC
jgi:threonine/homoserine/homoserine lactone efflux protein